MFNDMLDTIGFVSESDPEVGAAMQRELARQRRNIELIASENIVSPAVLAAMGSVLTNKYAEGYPGKRYYGGCEFVDQVENIAIERAKKLFGAAHANVQPHSGAQANLHLLLQEIEKHFRLLSRRTAARQLGDSAQRAGVRHVRLASARAACGGVLVRAFRRMDCYRPGDRYIS